jgi:hypothetical protein
MATAPGEVTRCGLDTSLDPRPVPLKGVAEDFRFAREGQARRRGSPRQPCGDQYPIFWSRSGRPSNAQGSGKQAYRLLCVRRRTVCTLPERYLRLLPLVASEATRAPPALLSPRRNGGRSKAVWRGHLYYTARAHVWARTVQAFPLTMFFRYAGEVLRPYFSARRERETARRRQGGSSGKRCSSPSPREYTDSWYVGRSQVRGQQIREHSADCAMLKIVLGESKVARMAPRAVFSHRKKRRLGGCFHL